MPYVAWRRRNYRICKVCKALANTGRKRHTVCTLEGKDFTLFVSNGHITNKVVIQPLPYLTLKENLQFYARMLYSARRQPIWIGTAIAARRREGNTVNHLREQMSMNRRYIIALRSALDDMGWLGSVDRIARRIENAENS